MWKGTFRVGLVTSILAALCCFTSVLPVVLTFLGLSGLIGVLYTDAVLLPILAVALIVTGFAFRKMKRVSE